MEKQGWQEEPYKKESGTVCDVPTGLKIPRTKRFYKKDSEGFYYIPEVVNNGHKN